MSIKHWLLTMPFITGMKRHLRLNIPIHRHVSEQCSLENMAVEPVSGYKEHFVIVPISGVHLASVKAFKYAKTLSGHVKAIFVSITPGDEKEIQEKWEEIFVLPPVILPSQNHSVLKTLIQYIDLLQSENPDIMITVVIPEFIYRQWWQQLFHNRTWRSLRLKLLYKSNVFIASMPFHLDK